MIHGMYAIRNILVQVSHSISPTHRSVLVGADLEAILFGLFVLLRLHRLKDREEAAGSLSGNLDLQPGAAGGVLQLALISEMPTEL